VGLCIADSARRSYGFEACVAEFERFLNSTLGPGFRLAAALAMGRQGRFIVTTDETGPYVIAPARPSAQDLAA
jgi:hypothetical protein